MPANILWNIDFGAYTFTVNRQDLTYRLQDTKSGTVWSDGLSLGNVEIQDRQTGETRPYSFGDFQLVSLSEKAGANGKRILFGLDAPGKIPVDVYLTCTEREIQITVEASRDTNTHKIIAVNLLPQLCAIPNDTGSYLVLPYREGAILEATDPLAVPRELPIWAVECGLTMAFLGAVRSAGSALALLTDSAYGIVKVSPGEQLLSADLRFNRDPERRRIDVRIVLLPGGSYLDVARAYRDKVIGDGQHIPLRRKMREKSALKQYMESGICRPEVYFDGGKFIQSLAAGGGVDNYWEEMHLKRDQVQQLRDAHKEIISAEAGGDWASLITDVWYELPAIEPFLFTRAVPLRSMVWQDAVPTEEVVTDMPTFLRALLRVAAPFGFADEPWRSTLFAVRRISLSAFLTDHHFLTANGLVEQATYSNGLSILINQSAKSDYETDDVHLPPLGFHFQHRDLQGYLALRVGSTSYAEPEWFLNTSGPTVA